MQQRHSACHYPLVRCFLQPIDVGSERKGRSVGYAADFGDHACQCRSLLIAFLAALFGDGTD